MTATLTPQTDVPRAAGPSSRVSAWLAIGAAILALVLAPPRAGDLLPAGVLGAVSEGQLEQLVGSTWRLAGVGDLIAEGAQVRTTDGGATIRTQDGALSLAAGTVGELDVGAVDLETGALLVESGSPTSVTTPVVDAHGRGTWRVDATASPRIGVYAGGVSVEDAAGDDVTVGALRQIDVVERAVAAQPTALRYLASDPWDARLLAGAVAVDRQVVRLEATLERTYGTALQEGSFYGDFVAVDEVVATALPGLARLREGERFGPPAETLVAVVVTVLLTERAGLSSRDAMGEIERLRRAGATWGLVLAAHDLGPDSFREASDAALRLRQEEIAGGTATPVVAGTGATPTDDDGEASDPAPPGDGSDPPSEPQPPSQPPPPEDDDGVVDEVGETVDDAADEVADLLEPVPDLSEAVDEVGDDLEDAADDLGGLLP